MLLQGLDVARYVKASAGRANLRVVFEDKCQPRHDGETIYLPRITLHTTQEQLDDIMASTDHEVAHDLYSDFGILQEKKISADTSPLGFIWNILEDSRVNALEATEYEGFRELWDKSCPLILDKIREKTKEEASPLNKIIKSLIKWDTKISSRLFPQCELSGSKFKTDEEIDKALEPFSNRLLGAQEEPRKKIGSAMTYDLAKDIFKALGGDPDEEEKRVKESPKPPEKEEKESPKEKPTETKAEDDKPVEKPAITDEKGPKEESLGKPETAKSSDEPKKITEDEWKIVRVEIKDVDTKLVSTHDTVNEKRMNKTGLLYAVDESGISDEWPSASVDDFEVVDYIKNTTTTSRVPGLLNKETGSAKFFVKSFHDRVESKVARIDNFAQQVRRLIQIRAKSQYEYGTKQGKMDYARLARLALKVPGFSERIFKKKVTNTVLDAAVTVLIDMSGSMAGDKVLFACEAAVLLNEVFNVLKVPVEILGFTDMHSGSTDMFHPISYVYKSFAALRVSNEDLIKNIGASSAHMTGNPDGDSILWAYDRLVRRKEKKRLLIVMSDGQPSASRHCGGLAPYTKQVIQEIEKNKRVEIYGLGLCDESVFKYYKHCSTVNTPEEIPTKLLELIERKLLND